MKINDLTKKIMRTSLYHTCKQAPKKTINHNKHLEKDTKKK
jgi:hypothetical protein